MGEDDTGKVNQPENWNEYPYPHYDEDGICQCPDHVAMREVRDENISILLRGFIEGTP